MISFVLPYLLLRLVFHWMMETTAGIMMHAATLAALLLLHALTLALLALAPLGIPALRLF